MTDFEKRIEFLTTKRYEVTTHSIAVIDHRNIDIVGIPLTEINGEVHENHAVVIEGKFTIGRILETFTNNIPISLRGRRNVPIYLTEFEELMDLLQASKSRNKKEGMLLIPNSNNKTLEDLIMFYNTLVQNNKKVVKKEFARTLENQFNLISNDNLIEKNAPIHVEIGDELRMPSNTRYREYVKPKKFIGGLRDEY